MIAVVDSGVANLASVMAALKRLDVEAEITSDAAKIQAADKVILPGVGAAGAAMKQLESKGLIPVLRGLKQPVLGICLGMQLMFDTSEEDADAKGNPLPCLGVISGQVRRLPAVPDMPVPHMGWNKIVSSQINHPLLYGVKDGSYVYFVHSFAAPVRNYTVAQTDYSAPFTAIAAQGNFYGCQFHPERSGDIGSLILKNFVEM